MWTIKNVTCSHSPSTRRKHLDHILPGNGGRPISPQRSPFCAFLWQSCKDLNYPRVWTPHLTSSWGHQCSHVIMTWWCMAQLSLPTKLSLQMLSRKGLKIQLSIRTHLGCWCQEWFFFSICKAGISWSRRMAYFHRKHIKTARVSKELTEA